jgi:signal transduction histidine kinase
VTQPALPGRACSTLPQADVVQSRVTSEVWRDMTPPDPTPSPRLTREEFASLVTHELRNPLNAMTGWLHLLSADTAPRPEAAQRALGGLRRALDQQLALIDTLGRVLRLIDGGRAGRTEPVELGALLAACADVLGPAAQAAGRDVRVECAAAPCWVDGSRAALLEALRTLGTFALRHGQPGAPLVLGLQGGSAEPVLRIEIDEGEDGGLSIWNGFNSGGRLSLDLLHALLSIEAQGARVAASGDGRVGDTLLIRFDDGATAPSADAMPISARPRS